MSVLLIPTCPQCCPLCSLKMKEFYCVDCVITGQFVHSKSKLYETYSEKSMRLFSLRREINETKVEIVNDAANLWKKEKLKTEIYALKVKLKYIRLAVRNNYIKNSTKLELLNKASAPYETEHGKLPDFFADLSIMEACKDKLAEDTTNIKDQLEVNKTEIRQTQSRFIQSLQKNIFTEKVLHSTSSYTNLVMNRNDFKGLVTLSSKPQSNNLVSFTASVEDKKRTILTLACQFTNLIADILCRTLPARVSILDLVEGGTSDESLARKVANLNMNVVTLCMFLSVQKSKIRPGKVMGNVSQMISRIREGEIVLLDSELGGWEDIIDSIYNEEIDSVDSDDEWEKVVTEYHPPSSDQNWESLYAPCDEAWEGLSIPSDRNSWMKDEDKCKDQTSLSRFSSSVSSLFWNNAD